MKPLDYLLIVAMLFMAGCGKPDDRLNLPVKLYRNGELIGAFKNINETFGSSYAQVGDKIQVQYGLYHSQFKEVK